MYKLFLDPLDFRIPADGFDIFNSSKQASSPDDMRSSRLESRWESCGSEAILMNPVDSTSSSDRWDKCFQKRFLPVHDSDSCIGHELVSGEYEVIDIERLDVYAEMRNCLTGINDK